MTDRNTLKNFFRKNQVPTEEQFKQLIDSGINMAEDHIFKRQEEPLSIEVGKNLSGSQTILNLHRDSNSPTVWGLELNPGKDTSNLDSKEGQGFSISDNSSTSRFFINESEHGEIGIGTIIPKAQLHIKNPSLSLDQQTKIEAGEKKLDGSILGGITSLELGEREKGNTGSIRLNGYDSTGYGFIKAGKSSLELDSTDGKLKVNSDTFMHNGLEGVLSIYDKSGAIGTQLTSDDSHSFLLKGNLGIGTSLPREKLDVNGSIIAERIVAARGNTTGSGRVAEFNSSSEIEPTLLNFNHKAVGQFHLTAGKYKGDNTVRFVAESANSFRFLGADTTVYENFKVKKNVLIDGNIGFNVADPIRPIEMELDGSRGWGRFSISLEDYWGTGKTEIGDEGNKYITLGASGAGVMVKNLHVPWSSDKATMRFGRAGGVSGHYFEVGMDKDGLFKIARDNYSSKGIFMTTSSFTGINNNNPQHELDVAGSMRVSSGTSGDSKLIIEADTDDNNESDNPYLIFRQDGGQEQSAVYMDSNRLILANSVSSGGITFRTGTAQPFTNASERMRIASNGNVGIGTTIPKYPLDVNGYIQANRALLIRSTATNGHTASFEAVSDEAPYINLNHKGKRHLYIMAGQIGGKNRIRFYSQQGSTFGFLHGNVGIGTESPALPLHVMTQSGTGNRYAIRIQHPSVPNDTWDIGIDGQSNGLDIDLLFGYKGKYIAAIDDDGTYQNGSDRILKKNIKVMPKVLDKVMNLKPSTYKFKASSRDKTKIGMIAQEVLDYFPELVSKKAHYSLDYNGFGVIAIKAIQEQQQMILKLQEEIKALK